MRGSTHIYRSSKYKSYKSKPTNKIKYLQYNLPCKKYTNYYSPNNAVLRKQGLRIDHFLLPPSMVDKLDKCYIDSKLRGLEKPSDHVPIVCEFKL